MIKRYHFSLDAWNLRTTRIDYSLAIDEFLRYMGKLMGNKIINGPTVIYRKEGYSGLTGSILTDLAHIIIHTISEPKELTVNICSYKDFSMDEVRDFVIEYFDLNLENLRVVNFSNLREEHMECEEPGCTREAVKTWQGRKVCRDHYDYYREQESKSKMYTDNL